MEEIQKVCTKCGVAKPVDDFYLWRDGRNGVKRRENRCKKCSLEYTKSWRKKNLTRRDWQSERLHYTYGMSEAQFLQVLAQQGGRCAICRDPLVAFSRKTHIDHCHRTGGIRGVLCHGCNVGLGKFRDSREYLLAAAAYLEREPLPFVHRSQRKKKRPGRKFGQAPQRSFKKAQPLPLFEVAG